MGLRFERCYPYLFGAVASCALVAEEYFGTRLPRSDAMQSSLVSLGGIFVAFLAATRSILLSMPADIRKRLKDSGYIEDLRSYLIGAQWSALVLCLVAVAGFSEPLRNTQAYPPVLLGCLVVALAALHRLSKIATDLLLS